MIFLDKSNARYPYKIQKDGSHTMQNHPLF